jgi:RNA polymerase sigma factor for flagellar operon FliA
MRKKRETPALAVYERYDLEERILSDTSLSRWFADVCAGKQPSVEVDEATLALLEGHGLVRKIENNWVLAPDGRHFARNLGLVPGPSKFEIDPSHIEKIIPKNEAELSAISDATPSLEKLWKTFIETRDEHCRNLLMEYYSPLVKYAAELVYSKLPDKVELDDLISAGMFGLMDAIDAFDISKGVKFETYCPPRIQGAILDELRSMDWVPRLVHARAHQLAKATHLLETHLGRKPTEEEIAEELDMDMEKFDKLQRDANAASQVSLNTKYDESEGEKDIREIDIIKDQESEDPLTEAQKQDLTKLLTKGLTRAERLIIVLYYYEEMTMKQIGAVLDLSECRVSQMHSSIIARLKAHMRLRKEKFMVQ